VDLNIEFVTTLAYKFNYFNSEKNGWVKAERILWRN